MGPQRRWRNRNFVRRQGIASPPKPFSTNPETAASRPPAPCIGDFQCWDLDLGDDNFVEFRSDDPARMTGQEVIFVGPVSLLVGYPALGELNPDWVMLVE
jgi:hypothetical protein